MKIKILLISVLLLFSMQKTFSQKKEFKTLETLMSEGYDPNLLLERMNPKKNKYVLSRIRSFYTKESYEKNEPKERVQYTYYKNDKVRPKRRIHLAKKSPYSSEYSKDGYTKYKYDDSYRLIKKHVYTRIYHNKKISYINYKKEIFTYYDNNKLKEYVMHLWDYDLKKWKQYTKKTYEYDVKGRITQRKEYWRNRADDGWGYLFADVHKYNEKGQLTDIIREASKNRIIKKTKYKYNKAGFLIKSMEYKGDSGYPDYIVENEFKDGLLVTHISYSFESGKKIESFKSEYEYNKSLDDDEVLMPFEEFALLRPYGRSSKDRPRYPVSLKKSYEWDRRANKWEEDHSRHFYTYKSLNEDKNLGIDEVAKVNEHYGIKVHENPVSNFLKVSWNSNKVNAISNIEIYDTNGNIVIKSSIIKHGESIPVGNLSSGVYFMNYKIDNKLGRIKIIKK